MTMKVNSAFGVDLLRQMIIYSLTDKPRLEIYSGTMPEVDDAFTYAPTNFAAQRLAATALNAVSIQLLNGVLRFLNMPAAFAATGTGTATWFALYNGGAPTYNSRVLIGSITDSADGTGVLILDTVNLVNGANVSILDLGVRLG